MSESNNLVRQVNMLSALFQNWDQVTKAQDIAANSMGATNDKYQIYLQSIEAAANKSKASWEAVWQTTINNDVIKFFYEVSAGIGDMINSIGGLIPLVLTFAGALLSLNFKSVVSGVSSVISSLRLMFTVITTGAAATATELAIATAGISLIIAGIVMAVASLDTATERLEKATQKLSETQSKLTELQDKKNSIKILSDEFNNLAENTKKSVEEQERFVEVQNELKELLPGIAGYYDQSGNFVLDPEALSSNQAYLDILQKQIDAERELLKIQAGKTITDGQKAYEEAARTVAIGTTEQPRMPIGSEGFYIPSITSEEIVQSQATMAELIATAYESYSQLDEAGKEIFKSSLSDMGEYGQKVLEIINGASSDFKDSFSDLKDGIQEVTDVIDESESKSIDLASSMDAITKASSEQIKEGKISYETALDLISANASLAQYLTQTADGYIFDADAARSATQAEMINEFTKYGLRDAAIAAANGNYVFAQSAIASSNATKEEKESMIGLLKAFAAMNVAVSIPSSGGGSAVSAQEKLNKAQKESYELEIKAYNNQKKAAQDQIKSLEDQKDAYNDLIDAKKESLRLAKEEKDYQDEVADKNKELADIDNELFAIQFDNSEEANAKRLQLEEERAKKTEEIAEMQADRTYDITVDALDAEAEAFANMIDVQIAGIERMISGFDAMIAKINEMIDALSKANNAGGGGSGGYTQPTKKSVIGPTGYDYSKTTIGTAESAAGRDLNGNGVIGLAGGGSFEVLGSPSNVDSRLLPVAPGEVGLALTRSQQNSVAPLASFFNSILKNTGTTPQFSAAGLGSGGISMGDIILQISGNVDRNIIPDIKSAVFDVLNQTNKMRGLKANAITKSI